MDLVTVFLLIVFVALIALPISGEVARVRRIATEARDETERIKVELEGIIAGQDWTNEKVDVIMNVCGDVVDHNALFAEVMGEEDDLGF